MASKAKAQRFESEIEKYRGEANWTRTKELARQLSQKTPDLGDFVNLVIAESVLEEYAEEHPPTERNITKAKSSLADVEDQLANLSQRKSKIGQQAQLLLAKLNFCRGNYQTAYELLDKAGLDSVTYHSCANRLIHMYAESFAIRGMCLEKMAPPTTSKYKAAEREDKIISCFEKAGDLALIYLQERDRSQGGMNPGGSQGQLSPDETVCCLLEQAIQESPILYIKRGQLDKGIQRFRELLRAVESRFTQDIRLTLARQLAEVLMRGVCEKSYIPLDVRSPKPNGPKPKIYPGDRSFVPEDQNEEALLLLLIAEAVATREAVLERSEELSETRLHAFHNTTAVYDMLALALVKRAQFTSLADSFERAMRFSFEEFHIWHQFANSLICAGKYSRAVLVLRECTRLQPENPTVSLQAAKLCFEYLHQYDEGIQWSKHALDVGQDHPMLSRAYMSLGIGYSMKAHEVKLQGERQILHRNALAAFQKAHTADPYDYLALFHLSLQLAILRHIPEALNYVKLALKYRSDHIHSLHLLVLLLTAQKQLDEAMVLIHAALEEYPDNLSLLLTKSKLEEVMYGPEEALVTCKLMLKLWKDIHEIDSEEGSERRGTATDRNAFDRRSVAQMTINEFSERGSGSIRAESVAASRVERALSEVASSMNSSFQPRPGSQQSWMLQAQIWLHLAELYLSLDKVTEAEACVQETSTIFPLSHQVYFIKGRVYEHKQRNNDAKVCFENAVSINPGHTKSLQHLGMVLHYLNENKLAEKVLRDAVNNDPTSHKSWHSLGMVLEALSQPEAASDCHNTGMELEATSPIVPFTVIPRLMQ
ncbi:tetratricopeptide repeat protein 7B-like [Haliotis asinina]|uniref:tetratricopeptide repeat protein 7B-like n=1 Tax=Haliotis asinina TaxID=109174 RepID=UPI003531E992